MERILVIEDDETVRRLIVSALGSAGYAVVEAEDGKQGIERFRATQPDLVITDVIMPDKDGLEVISELRLNSPQAKIIAISGGGQLGGDSYLRLAKALRATRTLAKPFTIRELLEIVREVVDEKTRVQGLGNQDPFIESL